MRQLVTNSTDQEIGRFVLDNISNLDETSRQILSAKVDDWCSRPLLGEYEDLQGELEELKNEKSDLEDELDELR